MKKMIDQAVAAAKSKPFSASLVLLTVAALGLSYALAEQLGWQLYQFTH
jgi:hypothetical protein